jgi:hypothetical protein
LSEVEELDNGVVETHRLKACINVESGPAGFWDNPRRPNETERQALQNFEFRFPVVGRHGSAQPTQPLLEMRERSRMTAQPGAGLRQHAFPARAHDRRDHVARWRPTSARCTGVRETYESCEEVDCLEIRRGFQQCMFTGALEIQHGFGQDVGPFPVMSEERKERRIGITTAALEVFCRALVQHLTLRKG